MTCHDVKKKKTVKPIFTRLIVVAIFWLLVFIALDPLSADKIAERGDFSVKLGVEGAGIQTELSRGTVISQTFIAPGNNLKGLDIRFHTYTERLIARFNVSVFDENGQAILREDVNIDPSENNLFHHFDIPVQVDSKGKQYEIRIKGINGKPNASPKVWGRTPEDGNVAIINGKQADYALDAELTCNRPNVYPAFFILIIVLSFAVAALATRLDGRSFLWLSFLLGILFIVINPFQHLLDENTHFIKSMAISRFTPHETVVDGKIGFMLPTMVDNIYEFNLNHHLEFLFKSVDSPIEFYVNEYTTSIIPINHVVAAVGLLLARIFHMSLGLTVWIGRLSNYLFYVIVCYFAIKKAKYYRSLFFIIAALPAALWMAASYSTDPVLLSTSLLFVSTCLKYRFSDERCKITGKDLLVLLGCSICIFSVKYFIYLPVATTFFLIPRECFEKRQRRNTLIAFAVIIAGMAIWQYALLKEFPIHEGRNAGTDFGGQIVFVFGHIGYTINNFLNWFLYNMVGFLQSTSYNSMFPAITGLMGTICLLSPMVAADKYPTVRIEKVRSIRIYCMVVFLFVSLLIMASLYAGFNPVGAFGIAGMQPRYFQPIYFFLMLFLAMTQIENHSEHYEPIMLMTLELYLLMSMVPLYMDVMR